MPLFSHRSAVQATQAGASPLLRNIGQRTINLVQGLTHNTDHFKVNALILSALIQVISRVYVSNRNAVKAKANNQADGPFLTQEAIKTTFREVGGFTMSYTILRYMQRFTTDVFRNILGVESGLSARKSILDGPTMFNTWMHKHLAPTGAPALKLEERAFPSLFKTLANIGGDIKRAITGKALVTAAPMDLKAIVFDAPHYVGVTLSAAGQGRFEQSGMLQNLVNATHWIAQKLPGSTKLNLSEMAPHVAQALKIKNFFAWAPIMVGSIPAILLSGYCLEKFSQNHAQTVAQKLARNFSKPGKTNTPAQLDAPVQRGFPDPNFQPEYVPSFDVTSAPEPPAVFSPAAVDLTGRGATVAQAPRVAYAGGTAPQFGPFPYGNAFTSVPSRLWPR